MFIDLLRSFVSLSSYLLICLAKKKRFLSYHPLPPPSLWLAFKAREFKKVWRILVHVKWATCRSDLPASVDSCQGRVMPQMLICLDKTSEPHGAGGFYRKVLGDWTGAASTLVTKDSLVARPRLPSEDEPPLWGMEGVPSYVIDLETFHLLSTKSSSWVVLSQIH